MSIHMLDTNIASHVIRGDQPEIFQKLTALPMEDLVVSAVTKGELRYGLAKRNYPARLTELVRQFLLRVDVLPWDDAAAEAYGDLRASCEARGITVASLDMLIAAHAVAVGATLVTRDKIFLRILSPLKVERWTDAGGAAPQ